MPPLTEYKLLPEGVCTLTLAQVERLFGSFQRSDRRVKLYQQLSEYVTELRQAKLNVSLIVNGSFVMPAVDDPEDIDLILVLPRDWDSQADVRPFEYNLLSKRAIKRKYGFDVFVVRDGSPEEREWIAFFTQINVKWCQPPHDLPIDCKKGLVRITL
ncbi:MAG: hypothetical protein HOP29_19630 [Phycisphaerales bacterium]|nr:hypothetical protein [Phycisphaerales bacterium]